MNRLLAVLAFSALAFGQTHKSSLTSNEALGQAISMTTGTTAGDVVLTQGFGTVNSGTVLMSTGSGTAWVNLSNGLPIESRKWDGKVTTKQHVDSTAHLIAAKELAPPGYIELAKSMGMKAPSEDEAELLKLIYQHGWKVYDFDKVDDYLWRQAASMKAYTRWVWKPMREKDSHALDTTTGASYGETSGVGYVYPAVYNKRVPMAVMEVAKCVAEDMENATFFVSDFEVIKPDPFLAVSTPSLLKAGKIFIVARWDEPGFQEEPITPGPLARK